MGPRPHFKPQAVNPGPSASFSERIGRLDLGLLQAVPTNTTAGDRRALLLLQSAARHPGYTYLEIGSEQGGSLQGHLADPWCAQVFSIDLRVDQAPDFRGTCQWYSGNTTAAMRQRLEAAFPDGEVAKLRTFDMVASAVPRERLRPAPSLVFIDAEHTDRAALHDFRWSLTVLPPVGWIAFHDSHLVCGGIQRALLELQRGGVEHAAGCFPDSSILAIALGTGARQRLLDLAVAEIEPRAHFRQARRQRWGDRLAHWRARLTVHRARWRRRLSSWRGRG